MGPQGEGVLSDPRLSRSLALAFSRPGLNFKEFRVQEARGGGWGDREVQGKAGRDTRGTRIKWVPSLPDATVPHSIPRLSGCQGIAKPAWVCAFEAGGAPRLLTRFLTSAESP